MSSTATRKRRPTAELELIRKAINAPRTSIPDICEALGKSRESVTKYVEGTRRFPPELRLDLAAFLRERAAYLESVALELEESMPIEGGEG